MMLHDFTELINLLKLDFPELDFSIVPKKCHFWSEKGCILENNSISITNGNNFCECKDTHTQLNLVINIPSDYYFNGKRIFYISTNFKLSEIPNLDYKYDLEDEFSFFKNYQKILRNNKLESIL